MIELIPSVRDYMTANPHSIQSDESVSTAQRSMQDHGVRHLLVWRDATLVGVVSERDLAVFLGLPEVSCERIRVEQGLASPPFMVEGSTALNRVARDMVERACDAAAVRDHGCVVGILTSTDLLVALADLCEGRVSGRVH